MGAESESELLRIIPQGQSKLCREAIAQSETTSSAFCDLAVYVRELKADLEDRARVDKEPELAGITKVAVRLAGIPDDELTGALSGLPRRATQPNRRRGWWGVIAGVLHKF